MSDPFVHLHVASGYSLQYGASHPHTLVERAVEQEMDTLALTDRDGTYGAVKFAKACSRAGIRPVLGVDLAVQPVVAGRAARSPGRSRTPVRGGAFRDEQVLPRVTLLAQGRAGWAAICRLVSATHLAGERGRPVADLDLLARTWSGGEVLVLLGPASELGSAVTRRRDDRARRCSTPWRGACRPRTSWSSWSPTGWPGRPGDLGARHQPARRPDGGPGPRGRVGAVLTNAVRYADRLDAPTVDVLDAARRLVAARPAPRRSGQRRGVPQVRQADARGGRGDLPARRPRGARRPAAAGPHPDRRRPVRPRPARRPGHGRGALPGVRARRPPADRGIAARGLRGRRGAAGALRGRRSAGATAPHPGSASGSGSTTSWR